MTRNHLEEMLTRIPALQSRHGLIEQGFEIMRDTFATGGNILLCGNRGSAADADHWSGELLKGFRCKRPLPPEVRKDLPFEMADRLKQAFPVIPLTGFDALSTAFANDVDPLLSYSQLVWALGKLGDLLIGISTSGNAKNVCAAIRTAHATGMSAIGLTGSDGGAMKALCDLTICVPAKETYLVPEYHLPIYHCLSAQLEEEFFGDPD